MKKNIIQDNVVMLFLISTEIILIFFVVKNCFELAPYYPNSFNSITNMALSHLYLSEL